MPSVEKRTKKKGKGGPEDAQDADSGKPTKEELSVLKYLHAKLPSMEAKFSGRVVNVFLASVALELLMNSSWAPKVPGKPATQQTYLFPTRIAATNYMTDLLRKGFFYRVEKLRKSRKTPSSTANPPLALPSKTATMKEKENSTAAVEGEESNQKSNPTVATVKKPTSTSSSKKSKVVEGKKGRMKVEFHGEQLFVDSPEELYMWVYEPIHWWNYVLGTLLLLVILLFCLFPLWPAPLRSGSYYVTVGAAGLFGSLMALGALRCVLFGLVWSLSFGRVHWWLLPNLFADCSVMDSFKPLCSWETTSQCSSLETAKSDATTSKDDQTPSSNALPAADDSEVQESKKDK